MATQTITKCVAVMDDFYLFFTFQNSAVKACSRFCLLAKIEAERCLCCFPSNKSLVWKHISDIIRRFVILGLTRRVCDY